MSDGTPTDAMICPVLSSPARRDAKGREVPPALVGCLEEGCRLYRVEAKQCALLEVPGIVDGVASLRESAEAGFEDASNTFEAAMTRVSRFLEQWQMVIENAGRQFSEIQREMGQMAAKAAAEVHGVAERMEQSAVRQDRLMGALDGVLRHLTEEQRAEAATRRAEEGEQLLDAGEPGRALFLLQKARGGSGGHPRLLNALGCAYLRLDRWEDAIRTLESCREKEPTFAAARANLGFAYLRKGQVEEAEIELIEALRLDPTSAAGWNTLGNLRFLNGRHAEAVRCWERAVEADPGLEAAWENLRRQQVVENRPFRALVARAEVACEAAES